MGEDGRVGRPVVALQGNDVPLVVPADAGDALCVEFLQPGKVHVLVGLLGRMCGADGLVEQVVAAHDPALRIALGQAFPQDQALLELIRVGKEAAYVVHRIVNVGAGLSAGGGVQVDEHVQPVFLAPVDQPVQQLESFLQKVDARPLLQKQPGVDGHPQGVVAHLGHQAYVALGDVAVPKLLPEPLGKGIARQLLDDGLDPAGPVEAGNILRAPHVPLAKEPVAQPPAHEQHILAVLIDDAPALHIQEALHTIPADGLFHPRCSLPWSMIQGYFGYTSMRVRKIPACRRKGGHAARATYPHAVTFCRRSDGGSAPASFPGGRRWSGPC